MARLEQVAQARYAGGLVVQQDAIRAQLEKTAMRSELIALDNDKRQLRARLNAMLARDAAAPLADPQALRALVVGIDIVLLLATVLALVFLSYLNPHLAVDLANRVWACF